MASLIRDRSASTAEMLEIFGDTFLLKAACSFEAALARALGAEGLLSASDVAVIVNACSAPNVDVAKLDGTAGGPQYAAQAGQQRRLSATAGAQQDHQ